MTIRIVGFLLLLLLTLPARAYEPSAKVIAREGSMPLILTVPHDGDETLGWAAVRTKGLTVRDEGTRQLAERTADLIEKKTGKRPYLVIAKFSRKYLDANRAEQDAQDSAEAIPAYRQYHGQIASYISALCEKYPGGALLIDVHGQSEDPSTIFRGTRNGSTVRALVKRSGDEALNGESSLTGMLQVRGYNVFPPAGASAPREDRRFNGAHTVFAYGSNNPGCVDAMQLEIGSTERRKAQLPEDLAEAIVAFTKKYYP